jgi:uncharacterized protein involved in tellurium resistance
MSATLPRRVLTLLAAMMMLVGCAQSPTEVYVNMTTAAQMGDKGGFLHGFTMKSRALVDSLISLSEAYGMNQSNPYTLLIFDEIEGESIDGDRAVLDVRHRSKTRSLLFVKEDCDGAGEQECDEGAWRIDTQELETYWDEKRK